MNTDEFRRRGHDLIDWIAAYLEHVEAYPVLSQVRPGDVRGRLPAAPPPAGEPFDAIMRDVEEIIVPGLTHWQSPNFFAFFPSNNSYPSILGDLLSSGLGVQGMIWATSPACTELETHVMDWLVEMLALPDAFRSTTSAHPEDSQGRAEPATRAGGVIEDTASTSTLVALIAARERATGGRTNMSGVQAGALTVYASNQAHSATEKGVRVAGLGSDNLRLVDVDASFAMQPDHLASLIAQDRAAGRTPAFVCATVGTTSSLAIDPLPAIGPICREAGAWLHVDAAMAGTAALCPELRSIHAGLEFADSYVFNPHKWMLTNFDCSAFFVRDRAALTSALSIVPEYLRNQASESADVIDYRNWQIALGRRFRALKLWFVIRTYGVSGLQEIVRRHVALARDFASWVKSDPAFELAAPPSLNLVCFRHKSGDEATMAILDRLNASGRLYLTHTRLGERAAIRMCIGQRATEKRHVEAAWAAIKTAAKEVAGK
jgi:aromatic-L-amino-acid decarboxylase